jgi:hypothetical protein
MVDVREVVKRFEIGDPIKSLFNPRFDLLPDIAEDAHPYGKSAARLRLTIHAPDAYGKLGVIPVQTDRFFYPDEMRDEKYLCELMRGMLKNVLAHEVDEAIQFDGSRIFDPHRLEPK